MTTTSTAAQPTRRPVYASTVGLVAAAISLGYGLLALAFPYPRITDTPFEVLWAIINLGYVGTLTAWVRSWPGPVPALGRLGWAVAVAGLLVRVADVAWFIARPEDARDWPVVASILLTFTGLALLGVASLRGGPRTRRWAPLLVLGVGVATALLYGPLPVLHFAVLGVVWGACWGLMAASTTR
jgi:hypothetical protein